MFSSTSKIESIAGLQKDGWVANSQFWGIYEQSMWEDYDPDIFDSTSTSCWPDGSSPTRLSPKWVCPSKYMSIANKIFSGKVAIDKVYSNN